MIDPSRHRHWARRKTSGVTRPRHGWRARFRQGSRIARWRLFPASLTLMRRRRAFAHGGLSTVSYRNSTTINLSLRALLYRSPPGAVSRPVVAGLRRQAPDRKEPMPQGPSPWMRPASGYGRVRMARSGAPRPGRLVPDPLPSDNVWTPRKTPARPDPRRVIARRRPLEPTLLLRLHRGHGAVRQQPGLDRALRHGGRTEEFRTPEPIVFRRGPSAAAQVLPGTAPAQPAAISPSAPSWPPAAKAGGGAEQSVVDLTGLTDRVLGEMDRRLVAKRERMGRV